MKLELFAIE